MDGTFLCSSGPSHAAHIHNQLAAGRSTSNSDKHGVGRATVESVQPAVRHCLPHSLPPASLPLAPSNHPTISQYHANLSCRLQDAHRTRRETASCLRPVSLAARVVDWSMATLCLLGAAQHCEGRFSTSPADDAPSPRHQSASLK